MGRYEVSKSLLTQNPYSLWSLVAQISGFDGLWTHTEPIARQMLESERTSEEVGHGWPSTRSVGMGDSLHQSAMELPAMNSRNDLISFLAVAQYYEIDIVSLTWQQGRGQLGIGGTSEIWQANYSKRMDFVFKRMKFADTDEEKGFNALVSEISILSHPLIRHHQNIVKLEGIGWDIPQQSHKVWPVLILEKAQLGDLRSFMCSEQGRSTTMRERLELCTDVASAIIAMHSNCKSKSLSSGRAGRTLAH